MAPQAGPALLSGQPSVAPSPPTGEIGNLPPTYAGGEIARGARLGMLGTLALCGILGAGWRLAVG